MSLSTALLGISAAVIILFSMVTSHIEHILNRLENRLESIANDIKYNQYLINTRATDNTNDKDIKVIIYDNEGEVHMRGEINTYRCKELLDKLTTTPVKLRIQGKIYTMYYHNGTLSNRQHM